MERNIHKIGKELFITSDEKIKEGDWVLSFLEDESYGTYFKIEENHFYCGFDFEEDFKKIILTTDQDLIKDGVQAIDDEFLEWFVNNPSCEWVEIEDCRGLIRQLIFDYRIIIPKEEPEEEIECSNCGSLMSLLSDNSVYACFNFECTSCYEEEPEEETLEEAAKTWSCDRVGNGDAKTIALYENGFIDGAKWQAERMYSEEDLREAFNVARHIGRKNIAYEFDEWFNRHKKKV